jgi:hypothetical protein
MPEFFNSTAARPMSTRKNIYRGGGAVKGGRGMGVALRGGGRVAAKDGKWIQKAVKGMRKDKPCTGKKFGSSSCPPGSKRYNLAKTFKKMAKSRKA